MNGLSQVFLRIWEICAIIAGLQSVSETAEIGIVSFGILGRLHGNSLLLLPRHLCPQLVGNRSCDLTFNCKDIARLSIKCIGPDV